jgi:exosome complex RNA-binding protein Csl4
MALVVTPGDLIPQASAAGVGTYEREGKIYAAAVGRCSVSDIGLASVSNVRRRPKVSLSIFQRVESKQPNQAIQSTREFVFADCACMLWST